MIRLTCPCQSESTFFGLTPEYRLTLHRQIFDLVYHGNGGFTWDSVYDMPVWLRIFYIQRINELNDAQRKEHEKHARAAKSRAPRATPPRTRK